MREEEIKGRRNRRERQGEGKGGIERKTKRGREERTRERERRIERKGGSERGREKGREVTLEGKREESTILRKT